jgi:hypothetical protein
LNPLLQTHEGESIKTDMPTKVLKIYYHFG